MRWNPYDLRTLGYLEGMSYESRFDVFMSVDGWCNGFDDPFANAFVLSKLAHVIFVVLCQMEHRKEVFLFVNVVHLDDC
jgi:hypothetical protein